MICRILPENKTIDLVKGESLLSALQRNGTSILAPCGGNGICKKCVIQVLEGSIAAGAEDKKAFSPDDLAQGFRLSCRAFPEEDITIRIDAKDRDLSQVSSALFGINDILPDKKEGNILGVDIGTTTIALALFSADSKEVKAVYTTSNHQRTYGADVISRIVAAGEGKAEELKRIVKEDIIKGVKSIAKEHSLADTQICITGNTTMEHLLLGYDTKGLGVFPFTPVSVDAFYGSWETLFENTDYAMPLTVMPGFTTYVGADILAGVLTCGMLREKKAALLIDLGTNGEMALSVNGKLFITSTAAGPAFEGGNISCGMAGINGAISKVRYKDGAFSCETIGHMPPEGICGSGIVDAVSECVKYGLIDETGLLEDDYFDDGILLAKTADGRQIRLTQQDIREMQLAKSAVRAGMETLIKKAGLSHADIKTIYLAGGFGQFIDIDSAVGIGMFSEDLKEKIVAAGNTALAGALYYAASSESEALCAQVAKNAVEIDLASDPDFKDGYMEYIMFGEDA